MKLNEVTDCLKNLGWKASTDEVGEKYTQFVLPDRIIQIIYGIRKYAQKQELGGMRSVSMKIFSKACAEIHVGYGGYAPLVRELKGFSISAPEILKEHVQQVSDESIAWGQQQGLRKALAEYAAFPTDAPGARPVWHLAALAVTGDLETLKSYQASFEVGDRLGFVPYVTEDYIDRAVLIAERHVAQP